MKQGSTAPTSTTTAASLPTHMTNITHYITNHTTGIATCFTNLSEPLLLDIFTLFFSARDLTTLEAVSRTFSTHSREYSLLQDNLSTNATLTECAAERRIKARDDRFRVTRRPGESNKYALHVLEELLPPLAIISAGEWHSMAATPVGKLFTWGCNKFHKLGLGTDNACIDSAWDDDWFLENGDGEDNPHTGPREWTPRQVEWLSKERVASVAAASNHSACLTTDGKLFTWGGYGDRLGLGLKKHSQQYSVPMVVNFKKVEQVEPFKGDEEVKVEHHDKTQVATVVGGACDTFCITATGELFHWGDLIHCNMSDYDIPNLNVPIKVEQFADERIIDVSISLRDTCVCVVTAAGLLHLQKPDDEFYQIKFSSKIRIHSVSVGDEHFAAVTVDGKLFTWGNGSHGQLGHGEEAENVSETEPRQVASLSNEYIKQVSCGCGHTGVVTASGHAWTWGSGTRGALGHGQFSDNVYEDDATMEGATENSFVPKRILELPGRESAYCTEISCGCEFSLVSLRTGEICSFGTASSGQLGLPQMAKLALMDEESLNESITWTSVPRVVNKMKKMKKMKNEK